MGPGPCSAAVVKGTDVKVKHTGLALEFAPATFFAVWSYATDSISLRSVPLSAAPGSSVDPILPP